LADYAKREHIEVIEIFTESKSAKQPGRPVFNEMMAKIHASKVPVGIIAWHPDRLARNSVDGGQIIYNIDTGKVIALRFPTFWFELTMFQVAFGQSKYCSDNLSENVKRGTCQKLGMASGQARLRSGYINNLKSHDIEPDPIKSKIIAKAFAEYATGKHSLESLRQRLSFWGVVNRYGKSLSISTVQRMLTCKAYIGVI
jgi:resolvase domain protein